MTQTETGGGADIGRPAIVLMEEAAGAEGRGIVAGEVTRGVHHGAGAVVACCGGYEAEGGEAENVNERGG